MSPLSWAPIGLKYLSNITLNSLSDVHRSFNISSIMYLVRPYGLLTSPVFIFSLYGGLFSPYTVADELNIIFFTPCLDIISQSVTVPDTLLSKYIRGFAHDSPTALSPAKWITVLISFSVNIFFNTILSRMSPLYIIISLPVICCMRLSTFGELL